MLPREDRYKAKNFIDTVVYRTGDQVGAWTSTAITGFGWGAGEVALLAIPLSALWLVNALWLGRRQEAMAAEQAAVAAEEQEPRAAVS